MVFSSACNLYIALNSFCFVFELLTYLFISARLGAPSRQGQRCPVHHRGSIKIQRLELRLREVKCLLKVAQLMSDGESTLLPPVQHAKSYTGFPRYLLQFVFNVERSVSLLGRKFLEEYSKI